jgi:hypothetical protein
MPVGEEADLTTQLWRATIDAENPLTQDEIDRILGVKRQPEGGPVPEQRTPVDPEAWSRIRTDAGDQKWLNHLVEPRCWEF